MNRAYKIVLHIFFIVYIVALYGFIAPAHGHKDFLEHHDCVICQLSGMAATVAAVFVLIISTGSIVTVSLKPFRVFSPTFELSHPTRAPPLYVSIKPGSDGVFFPAGECVGMVQIRN